MSSAATTDVPLDIQTENMTVNSRERVKKAIAFGGYDHPPISHAILPAAQIKYGEALDEILVDVPLENIRAMYETFKRYGRE